MHKLIEKLLKKRGIEDIKELDKEERETFDAWQSILSKEELTIEDIKKFCQSQIDVIEGKWKDLEISNAKKSEWIPIHTVYKLLLAAINSPRSARESLEMQLTQLIK